MRRERRKLNRNDDEISTKIIKYAAIGVGILAIIVFGLLLYSKNLNDEVKQGTLTAEQMATLMNGTNTESKTESASTEMGKNVNEAKNEMATNSGNSTVETNTNNTKQNNLNTNSIVSSSVNNNSNSKSKSSTNSSISNNSTNTNNSSQKNSSQNLNNDVEKTETKKELSFQKPVEGEVVREFAKDNLVFSETLQEWTTHMGIDIKAEKTTVVKAAEAGTVKTIKNDPRYGLTIVVEHADGFQTVYANLLTSEFVVEGEKVENGQSLGTVGNTAVFEVSDEPHLHFEILKDSEAVDPTIYIK